MSNDLRAIYLTGDKVYMRAYVMEDKEHAAAWMDSPYPINSSRAEEILKDWHKEFWPDTRRYAICRLDGDEIVGGITISTFQRTADIKFHMAPWLDDADELRADALRVVVPWMSVEWDMISVTAKFASDQPITRAAAEELEMEHNGTFREFYARPGGRADQLLYQKLNPRGEFPNA